MTTRAAASPAVAAEDDSLKKRRRMNGKAVSLYTSSFNDINDDFVVLVLSYLPIRGHEYCFHDYQSRFS